MYFPPFHNNFHHIFLRGHPGYNPDLMVMDLGKLREDKVYKSGLTELKLSLLLRKYSYHPEGKLPTLGEKTSRLRSIRAAGIIIWFLPSLHKDCAASAVLSLTVVSGGSHFLFYVYLLTVVLQTDHVLH